MGKRISGIAVVLALVSSPLLGAEREGVLEWNRRAELGSPITGVVTAVSAQAGQRVESGQSLVQLDDRRLKADLAEAQANLKRLTQVREEAEREMERADELYARTLLSDHELEVAKLARAAAEAEFTAARAALTRVQIDLEYSTVRAPFRGVVLETRTSVGETVVSRLQAHPLVVLADLETMTVRLALPESQLASLSEGQALQIRVGGQSYSGKLQRVGLEPLADSTYPVFITFTPRKDHVLRVGQRALVQFP